MGSDQPEASNNSSTVVLGFFSLIVGALISIAFISYLTQPTWHEGVMFLSDGNYSHAGILVLCFFSVIAGEVISIGIISIATKLKRTTLGPILGIPITAAVHLGLTIAVGGYAFGLGEAGDTSAIAWAVCIVGAILFFPLGYIVGNFLGLALNSILCASFLMWLLSIRLARRAAREENSRLTSG